MNPPPPALHQFRELQPISSFPSLCTNRAPCALLPLNPPAALLGPEHTPQTDCYYSLLTKTVHSTESSKMNPMFRRTNSVCRNLFGPVDQEQLRQDLKQRLREIAEQDCRRWNFNFLTDTPMCGRFQWEEISADCAAGIYQESAELKDKAPKSEEEEVMKEDRLSACKESAMTDQENCSNISNTPKCPAEVTPARRKRTHARPAAKSRNNAKITDFFAKRRRSTEAKSILNPYHTSSSEAALCKTIR